jgi:hypothetical protein
MTDDGIQQEGDKFMAPNKKRQRGRRVPHFETLSQPEKKRLKKHNKSERQLREIEQEVQTLMQIKQANGGSLHGTGARNAAAAKFKVSVWTIDNWLKRYEQNPTIDSLIDRPSGRTAGQDFTPEQEALICYFYLNPGQKTVFPEDGTIAVVPRRSKAAYIHALLVKFCPKPPKSIHQVRRYLSRLRADDPTTVSFAREGAKFLRDRLMPTSRNDVDAPHKRWQMDGRPLPIYIIHDGIVCTVSLLLIMDDFSRYIVRARLIPRVLRNEQGLPKRAEFNRKDVGLLVGSAMYHCRMRPWDLYTDNGSQIVTIGLLLGDLSEEHEILTTFARTIPGRPRGRGKIERLLAQFDELVVDLPGCAIPIEGESEFDAINRARNDAQKLTLQALQKRVDAFISQLNDKPPTQRHKESRKALWDKRKGVLSSPPIRNLMVIVPEGEERDVRINNWLFKFHSHEHDDDWEPRVENEEDMYRWLVAIARHEPIPLRAVKLDDGWKVEVCLDRDDQYWCEAILKSQRESSKDRYNQLLGSVTKRVRTEHAQQLEELLPIIQSIGADLSLKHQITKQPVVPSEINMAVPDNTVKGRRKKNQKAESSKPAQKEDGTSPDGELPIQGVVSARTSPSRQKPQTSPKIDWSKVGDIDELERELKEERRKKEQRDEEA